MFALPYWFLSPRAVLSFMLLLLLVMSPSRAHAQTLTVCTPTLSAVLNPALLDDPVPGPAGQPRAEALVADLIAEAAFDTLVRRDTGSARLVPGLAERWETSDDGLTWTFYLRDDASFPEAPGVPDGTTLTAQDVVFSLTRLFDNDHPFRRVSGGGYHGATVLDLPRLIKGIEAVDEATVQISLSEPDSGLAALLSRSLAAIHPKAYGEAVLKDAAPERLDQRPIGSGPFAFAGIERTSEDHRVIRFTARENHWSGTAKFSRLTLIEVPDPDRRKADIRSGSCHLALGLGSRDDLSAAPTLIDDPELSIETGPLMAVSYLVLNTRSDALATGEQRQKLSNAIAAIDWTQTTLADDVTAASGLLPPSFGLPAAQTEPSPDSEIQDPATDTEYEAEQTGGADDPVSNQPLLRLVIPAQSRPDNPDPRETAAQIAAAWAEIGIDTTIVPMEWGPLLADTRHGGFDALLFGWVARSADPVDFLAPMVRCAEIGLTNRSNWCDDTVDALLDDAQSATTTEDRDTALLEAQTAILAAAPVIPLLNRMAAVAGRSDLSGLVFDPFQRVPLRSLTIDE